MARKEYRPEVLFKSETREERLSLLKDTALKVIHDYSYGKDLTDDEIEKAQRLLGEEMVVLRRIEKEKANAMADFKLRITPHKDIVSNLVETIETRKETIEEDVFMVADEGNQRIIYYNEDGEPVFDRPMAADERQHTIMGAKMSVSKTASGD